MTEGRVALITGAARGIGAACVRLFRDEGWRVIGVDFDACPDADRSIELDLVDTDGIRAAIDAIKSQEGRLDALVNNAALQVLGAVDEISIEDWDRTMAVNVRAPFWLLRCALPLLEASGGAVVNVSSVHAVATSPQIAAYATSKGALATFTRAAALDLAPRGVRVNAVLPGAVDTPMLRAGFARGHLPTAEVDAQLDEFAARHPVGRVGRPVEVALAVLHLADSTRSPYVTGACLTVDGGVTARLSTE